MCQSTRAIQSRLVRSMQMYDDVLQLEESRKGASGPCASRRCEDFKASCNNVSKPYKDITPNTTPTVNILSRFPEAVAALHHLETAFRSIDPDPRPIPRRAMDKACACSTSIKAILSAQASGPMSDAFNSRMVLSDTVYPHQPAKL